MGIPPISEQIFTLIFVILVHGLYYQPPSVLQIVLLKRDVSPTANVQKDGLFWTFKVDKTVGGFLVLFLQTGKTSMTGFSTSRVMMTPSPYHDSLVPRLDRARPRGIGRHDEIFLSTLPMS